jgi:hypothetical protein
MVITYVYPNEPENWENIEWRCTVPFDAINRTGIHKANMISDAEFTSNSNACITMCLESDVIVIYKKLYGRVISAIHHWQAREKTIIVDFDEAYQLLDPATNEYKFWFDGVQIKKGMAVKYISPAPMTQFKWGLKLVDGITVSSNRLASDWITFNNISVVPDYIHLDLYTPSNRSQKRKKIVLGWHGKSKQLQGLMDIGIGKAICDLLNKFPNLFFQMYVDDEPEKAIDDEDRLQIFYNVRKKDWDKALPTIDIGLLPISGKFDQRQSDRSVLEYLVMKIPWIASQGSAFHEILSYGNYVENNIESWMLKLEEMIIHYDDFKTNASQAPYLSGIEKSVDENIHHTIDLYEKIFLSKKR